MLQFLHLGKRYNNILNLLVEVCQVLGLVLAKCSVNVSTYVSSLVYIKARRKVKIVFVT